MLGTIWNRTVAAAVLGCAAALGLALGATGCSSGGESEPARKPPIAEDKAEPRATSPEERAQDHDDAHAHDDGDHEHGDGDQDHGHDVGDLPDTVTGMMDAIHHNHEAIETAETDDEVLAIHDEPVAIVALFEKLRNEVELSEAEANQYDKLFTRLEKTADLMDKYTHDEKPDMVRRLIERINPDIEALEKLAAPDHVHEH